MVAVLLIFKDLLGVLLVFMHLHLVVRGTGVLLSLSYLLPSPSLSFVFTSPSLFDGSDVYISTS